MAQAKLKEEKPVIRKGKDLKRANKIQLYIMCVIPLLIVFIFHYLPMGGAVIAFKDYKYAAGIFGSEWVGLDNFKILFASDGFTTAAVNTIVLNAVFILVSMSCSLLLAIVLYEINGRGRVKTYQTIMITPHFLSWVVIGYMAYGFLNPQYGIINNVIQSLGGEKIQWYSKPEIWPAILTMAFVWKHMGMDMILFYAALMGIDSELFEAASIDGATKVQRTWHITVPLIMSTIVILFILKLGKIFKADFGLFYQLTRNVSKLYPTTDVMDTYIFRMMREVGDMSTSSAAGLLQSVVGFTMVMITNKFVKLIDNDYALF